VPYRGSGAAAVAVVTARSGRLRVLFHARPLSDDGKVRGARGGEPAADGELARDSDHGGAWVPRLRPSRLRRSSPHPASAGAIVGFLNKHSRRHQLAYVSPTHGAARHDHSSDNTPETFAEFMRRENIRSRAGEVVRTHR